MINFVNLFNLFLLLFMSLIALFDSLCPTCNRLAYIGWLIERPAADRRRPRVESNRSPVDDGRVGRPWY